MRKIILFVAASLDGYIARENGGVDWLFTDQDYGFTAFMRDIDTTLIGRKTYDFVAAHREAADPFAGCENIVFSRTLPAGRRDGYEFVDSDAAAFVSALRRRPGRNIWLIGGGQLTAALLDASLVDEIVLSFHPLILGAGLPLFPRAVKSARLAFREVTHFSSGLVQLRYGVQPTEV